MGIIIKYNELPETINKERASGKSIVLADGAFDIFHVGHLRYLRGARENGDILLVAVYDDDCVRARKGENRPIVPLEDRMKIVAAMEPVDYVTAIDADEIESILREIRPDVYARGADHNAENEIVAGYGGRVAIVGGPKDHSSSGLIERISKKK